MWDKVLKEYDEIVYVILPSASNDSSLNPNEEIIIEEPQEEVVEEVEEVTSSTSVEDENGRVIGAVSVKCWFH